MKGSGEKYKVTIKSGEQQISPEMRGRFNTLIRSGLHMSYLFNENSNWSVFHNNAWQGTPLEYKKTLLESRKVWFAMKEGGLDFKEFLEDRIRQDLDARKGSEAYRCFNIYTSLYGVDDLAFLCDMLDHESVWGNRDGSLAHGLVDAIGKSENQDAISVLIRYMDNILSPNYKRKEFIGYDIGEPVGAMIRVVGEEKTKEIIGDLAEKDTTLSGWLEKAKINVDSLYFNKDKAPMLEVFDSATEHDRIATLEKELEEFEKNPPAPKHHMYENYDYEGINDPFDDPDTFSNDVDEEEEDDPMVPPQMSTSVDINAKRWEHGTLLNFYGRFKPLIEDPIAITNDNYIDGIVATIRKAHTSPHPGNYLGILHGVIDQKDLGQAGEKVTAVETIEEAYGMAAVACARGLSVGVLENRVDDAMAEIHQVEGFIRNCAAKFDNQPHTDFLLSLVDQLGQLRVFLSELRNAGPLPDLPESSRSFLITHPSMKRVREVADFRDLLAEKIKWYIAHDLAHNLQSVELHVETKDTGGEKITPVQGPSFSRLKHIIHEYREGLNLYQKVEESDVPVYLEAKESLLKDFDSRRNVVFGRDGRYFFTALKASEFGQKRSILKYVVITTPMTEHSDRKHRDAAVAYLRQNGVTLDFNFIDTGFNGSIPEFAIKALADADNVRLSEDEVDSKIKLLLSYAPDRRTQIVRRGNPNSRVHTIEDRPKSIDKPHYLVADEGGKVHPKIRPRAVREQLRAWIVEQVSLRAFAPKLDYNHLPLELKISPQNLENLRQRGLFPDQIPEKIIDEMLFEVEKEAVAYSWDTGYGMDSFTRSLSRKEKFSAFIEKHLADINKEKREEILKDATRLYEVSRDKVGPVIVDFARWCLERTKPEQQVLFLARDGLAPWIAAKLLVRQGKFPGISDAQLHYVHLSRNIIGQEDRETVKTYLSQFGVDNDENVLTVDVGMYGAIHQFLEESYPDKKIASLYLIAASQAEGIEGYLFDAKGGIRAIDPLWKSISGNPAIHFLEDTFSGFYGSTQGLEKSADGTIKPTLGVPYSREVYLKRLAAIDGIMDRALSAERRDPEENSIALNTYLSTQFQEDKKHIMVPHE